MTFTIEYEEEDGRWLAEVLELPGAMADGQTAPEAVANAKALALRVPAALLRIGWRIKRESGSHKVLSRAGWADVVFPFHDKDEIGPRMPARIAKHTPASRGMTCEGS
jgi:predicted RNase H-like HicB family nuclease